MVPLAHCETCIVLDKCWFNKSRMPRLPLHPRCHCAYEVIPRPTPGLARAECAIEKFTGYIFNDEYLENDRQYNQSTMRFCIECPPRPLCCAVLKYARYVFAHAPRGHQRAFMQKSSTAEEGNFPVLQGGRTQKYRAYFKDDNAAKRRDAPFGGALYFDCIVYTKAGVKAGDFGAVMSEKSIDGYWYVIFSEFHTGEDIANIEVREEDLKVYEHIPPEKVPPKPENAL